MRLQSELRPGTAQGAYSAPPDFLAGFGKRKRLGKGEEVKGYEWEVELGERKTGKGMSRGGKEGM